MLARHVHVDGGLGGEELGAGGGQARLLGGHVLLRDTIRPHLTRHLTRRLTRHLTRETLYVAKLNTIILRICDFCPFPSSTFFHDESRGIIFP